VPGRKARGSHSNRAVEGNTRDDKGRPGFKTEKGSQSFDKMLEIALNHLWPETSLFRNSPPSPKATAQLEFQ
jgi:hypothetical protein